jgi:Holliday junction resolvasome RuvABC endonuclease subunit
MAKKKPRKPNAAYMLPDKPSKKYVKCLLALDPGSRNMGISCVGVTKKGKVRVLANSILTNPFTTMVGDIKEQKQLFLGEIDSWVKLYKPNGIIMERFQSRGGMGPLIELVTLMLGILVGTYNLPIKMITAATWKNAWHRKNEEELNDMYKECLTTPHQLDSILIGCYGLHVATGMPTIGSAKGIMRQAADTSLLPLIKRKGLKCLKPKN